MSKRTNIAEHMANSQGYPRMPKDAWLKVIYAFEREGYQVVKNSETAEYHGLRVAGDGED